MRARTGAGSESRNVPAMMAGCTSHISTKVRPPRPKTSAGVTVAVVATGTDDVAALAIL